MRKPRTRQVARRLTESEMLAVEAALARAAGIPIEEITAHRAEIQAGLREMFEKEVGSHLTMTNQCHTEVKQKAGCHKQ